MQCCVLSLVGGWLGQVGLFCLVGGWPGQARMPCQGRSTAEGGPTTPAANIFKIHQINKTN